MLRPERPLHRVRPVQRAIQRPRAQRAAADANQADRIERAAHFGRVLLDLLDDGGLEWQMRKAVAAFLDQLPETRQRVQRRSLFVLDLGGLKAVHIADHRGAQVDFVELDLHVPLGPPWGRPFGLPVLSPQAPKAQGYSTTTFRCEMGITPAGK